MDYLFQDGGKPKKAKTTKSKTPKKGGNSLGSNSKKGEMNGGAEKNPLEKYKDALKNINSYSSNNRLAAFRYLASIKSMPGKPANTTEIEEMLNNIQQNVLHLCTFKTPNFLYI
jgi:hypothetical protein